MECPLYKMLLGKKPLFLSLEKMSLWGGPDELQKQQAIFMMERVLWSHCIAKRDRQFKWLTCVTVCDTAMDYVILHEQ